MLPFLKFINPVGQTVAFPSMFVSTDMTWVWFSACKSMKRFHRLLNGSHFTLYCLYVSYFTLRLKINSASKWAILLSLNQSDSDFYSFFLICYRFLASFKIFWSYDSSCPVSNIIYSDRVCPVSNFTYSHWVNLNQQYVKTF